jgi:hypothetical protein
VSDQLGAAVRFTLGLAVSVGVYFGARALDIPVVIAVVLALVALYLFGAISTNGYLPFTHRWRARRAAKGRI